MDEKKKIIMGFCLKDGQAILETGGMAGALPPSIDWGNLSGTSAVSSDRAAFTDPEKMTAAGDPVALAQHFSDQGADELYIFDMSEGDEDHERSIGVMKEIARASDSPIIAGGRVKRLEDVKKYLYAGAKAVFLDGESEENVDLIKEAADRFGSEKIFVRVYGRKSFSRLEEFAQLGASGLIIDRPDVISADESAMAAAQSLPCYMVTAAKKKPILMRMAKESTAGVILPCEANLPEGSGVEPGVMGLKHWLKSRGVPVDTFDSAMNFSEFKLNSDGLIPAIVQDYKTGEVLMLAYMNEESFNLTVKTGRMTYFSRSRQSLWVKGETSGHFQYVKSLTMDCDNDTLLAKVRQVGPACHTGAKSCFFKTLVEREYQSANPLKVFEDVYGVILDRKANPKEGSYTNYLFDKGIDKILKKVGEEATEIVIAAKNPNPEEVKYEISDFLYHMMVLMAVKGLSWEDITEELANR